MRNDARLGVPLVATPETVVVDYSAPNVAKEMHVGHLRSTIIGDALDRTLEFAGHKVVRQNHVGDWGTQFGMLVAHLEDKAFGLRMTEPDGTVMSEMGILPDDLEDLEEFYREAKKRFDEDPEFARRARERVVSLQAYDKDTYWKWERFRDLSMQHAKAVYDQIGCLLTDDDTRGESAYNGLLSKVIEVLNAKGLLSESEGAQCVFLKDKDGKPLFVNKDGEPLPLIVQKSDEGFLYATTDLAAIGFRTGFFERLPILDPDLEKAYHESFAPLSPRASRILYVVDARQALHFKMVFETARRAGFAKPETVLEHIAFGTMMGPDGKPFKTREGGTVKLMDLLKEAEKRALDLVREKNAADVAAERAEPLSEEQMADIAHKVGIGAVKYADLSQNRTSDYVFSWEKMLALDGNTAPYMQYAYARIRSIFRRGEHNAAKLHQDASPIPLDVPQEVVLAKKILQFAEMIDRTLDDYRPNILAAYLYDLAGAFTAFYDACPVIQSAEPTRTARLKLCDLTARVMKQGLCLLGIETAERM
jgi:arginyl-tRNA synthetase